jgi:hypothetical protein
MTNGEGNRERGQERVSAMSELLAAIAPAIKKAVEAGCTLDDIKNLLNDLIAIVESEEE